MAKTVTCHQPNYLPWIGLFSKIMQGNYFIIYDNAQYTNGVINRNKIRTRTDWVYLTIPIKRCFSYSRISNVTLPERRSWQREHWLTIYSNYAKAPFFKEHRNFFETLYHEDFQYLWQLNEKIIKYLLTCFNIKVEIVKTSQMDIDPTLRKTDAIIAYLKTIGAEVYISGPSGRDYLEVEKFPQNKIDLKFFKFQHPIYRQRYTGFEANMAAIDLLFNLGPEAAEIMREAGGVEDCLVTIPQKTLENTECAVKAI